MTTTTRRELRPATEDQERSPGQTRSRRRLTPRGRAKAVGFYAILILLSLIFLVPLFWMISTSFKTAGDAAVFPPQWLPAEFSVQGYEELFTASQAPVLRWLFNSTFVGIAHTLLVILLAALAAYAFARLNFPGRNVIFGIIIATLAVPGFVFLMPSYLIVDAFGWLDNPMALILPSAASAFGVFFLRQFFISIPGELVEAARLDGANHLQIFFRIFVPLSKAPIATLAVISFLGSWNDFLWPLYVLFNPDNLTLPAGLATLQGAYSVNVPAIMAGAVLASLPVLAVFIFAQRYIIAGVSRSGLKG